VNKYRNQPVVIDGHRFPSKKEGNRYLELKLLERAGEISHLEIQPKFMLIVNGSAVKSEANRKLHYIGDFSYFDARSNKRIVEDVKGVKTDVYKLKKALVQHIYPAVKIIEI
jgi:hypothetical protein